MIILILILFGLCFGSFANALAWRVHEQAKPRKKRAASDAGLSMLRGRSMCTHCHHILRVADLIPLFSWLALRGRCRYCHKPIEDTPLAEALLPVAFVLSYVFWPWELGVSGVAFVVWLISLVAFTALIISDVRWTLLPDRIVLPLIVFTGLHALFQIAAEGDIAKGLWSLVGALTATSGLFYGLYRLSRGRWIGGGDYTLGLALGFLLMTPKLALLTLFLASLLGTLYALPYMLTGKMKRGAHVPFGPFLMIATFVVQLFGVGLIDWYVSLIDHLVVGY